MRRITFKHILVLCMVTNLMSSSAHAAVGDFFSRAKARSKEYVLRKIDEAGLKTQELLVSLRANTNCLVRGDCSHKRMVQLRAIAGAIAAAVAVVTAAAIVSKYAKEDDSGSVKAAAITEFLPDYVPDDSEQGMFMKGVHVGLPAIVKQYADLVSERVLKAGTQLAARMRYLFPDKLDYVNVQSYLESAQSQFDKKLQQANEYLLAAVRQEDQELVTRAYCGSPTPSPNAITVGIEILKDRGRRYTKEVYDKRIQPIINFLKSPRCSTSG